MVLGERLPTSSTPDTSLNNEDDLQDLNDSSSVPTTPVGSSVLSANDYAEQMTQSSGSVDDNNSLHSSTVSNSGVIQTEFTHNVINSHTGMHPVGGHDSDLLKLAARTVSLLTQHMLRFYNLFTCTYTVEDPLATSSL